jgi:4-hydroxyphenylpyruvate dioxygenase-like putative hemolysin
MAMTTPTIVTTPAIVAMGQPTDQRMAFIRAAGICHVMSTKSATNTRYHHRRHPPSPLAVVLAVNAATTQTMPNVTQQAVITHPAIALMYVLPPSTLKLIEN